MCGIVGYIGKKEALPFLLSGLKRLEYRGYDSAGIATFENERILVARCVGKLCCLEKLLEGVELHETIGIGHTRWATHGVPSDENSHPHRDCNGHFAVVHNGIIENYLELRRELKEKGCTFSSETDTEVLPNLIDEFYEGDLLKAAWALQDKVRGSYAAVFMSDREPDKLVALRKDSPLIIGIGDDGYYIASDIPAILGYAHHYLVLEDGESAVLTRESLCVYRNGQVETKVPFPLTMSAQAAEKGGYEHFMLKEINEQPRALRDCLAGRLSDGEYGIHLGEVKIEPKKIKELQRIVMVACGTAYHACLVAKYVYEQILRIPVEVDIASEFRYRDPIIGENTLTIVVSQSGETADTLAALKEARSKGSYIIAITNVVGSSVAREADDTIYTRAGHEIAVASTKAYSTQLLSLYLLGFYMAEIRKAIAREEIEVLTKELYRIPGKVESVLTESIDDIKKMSSFIAKNENSFFIGRGLDYAVALEGALKLKEISYIHAEAYAAGELKHGTLALIVDKVPVMAVCTQSAVIEKMISNIREVTARDATVFAFAFEGDNKLDDVADQVLFLPRVPDLLSPILTVVPLQLIAYYASVMRGTDVDQPRNLAKSVTVE